MQTRIKDIQNLRQQNDKILFIPRIFSGGGPTRQFEAGHQKGGNYSCLYGARSKEHQNLEYAFNISNPSLEERVEIFKGGKLWKNFDKKAIPILKP